MNVAIDNNGYYYDVNTGNNLSVCYDMDGSAYDCASGASVRIIGDDGSGSGNATDITLAVLQTLRTVYGNQPQSFPTTQFPPVPINRPGPNPNPSGGINLSNTTLMLIVGGVLLFVLGQKKGRG